MKNILIFSGLISLLFCVSCESEKHEKTEKTTFLVTSPLKKDTVIYREYVCQIRSIQHIELRTLEEGYLQNILVDEGQFVKKGQLLFQLMPIIYQAEVQKAQAEVNYAEIEWQNTKNLADSNIVSQTELALAKARLDKAKAELALSQAHLGFTQIRAPFDGIVGRFNEVRVGSLLDKGELLTTLSDNSKMWVYFNVPEAEYLDYTYNSSISDLPKVTLQMANNRKFDYPGVIETIEADFNNETGNIAFRATFQNPKGILRHGETGNILMPLFLKDALLIPQKATFEVLDKKCVFVVEKNGRVRSRQITVGAELPHLYVITGGLSENDQILLEGLQKVRDMDEIAYKYLGPDSVMSQLELYAE
jgi:membrane fusion protein (multidrug efflux system)